MEPFTFLPHHETMEKEHRLDHIFVLPLRGGLKDFTVLDDTDTLQNNTPQKPVKYLKGDDENFIDNIIDMELEFGIGLSSPKEPIHEKKIVLQSPPQLEKHIKNFKVDIVYKTQNVCHFYNNMGIWRYIKCPIVVHEKNYF